MARNFHRKDRLAALTEINVTPLIDLAFALLIIFMITTPLLEQTIELNLPVETAKSQSEEREDFQSVSINREGFYFWGDQQVSEQQLGELLDHGDGSSAVSLEYPRGCRAYLSASDYTRDMIKHISPRSAWIPR